MTDNTELVNKTPHGPKKDRWRTLAIEVILFAALGIFAFTLVSSLVRGEAQTPSFVDLAALVGSEEEEVVAAEFGLYEAPSQRDRPQPQLSTIFTPSVQYWREEIIRWSGAAGVDPNLAATVMQIESCGWPTAGSPAGAQGLFQVMPFHFEEGEEMNDPDTNAYRGLNYLVRGLEIAEGHAGLAMAGYNGGHSVITRDYSAWPNETQRYYRWGTGIYREASAGWDSSPTLANWLAAGGSSLCETAESTLNIR